MKTSENSSDGAGGPSGQFSNSLEMNWLLLGMWLLLALNWFHQRCEREWLSFRFIVQIPIKQRQTLLEFWTCDALGAIVRKWFVAN